MSIHWSNGLVSGDLDVGGGEYLTVSPPENHVVGAFCPWSWHLAHNLAIAAALCEAFTLGGRHAEGIWDFWQTRPRPWRPGCGRSAP